MNHRRGCHPDRSPVVITPRCQKKSVPVPGRAVTAKSPMYKPPRFDVDAARRPYIVDCCHLDLLPIGAGFIYHGDHYVLLEKPAPGAALCGQGEDRYILPVAPVVVNPTMNGRAIDLMQLEAWNPAVRLYKLPSTAPQRLSMN